LLHSSRLVLGYPAGAYVDRFSCRKLIAGGLLVWSAATVGCAFWQQLCNAVLFRMLVGVGETTLSFSAYSLISDLFPRERRGLPLSVFQTASPIGLSISAFVGGSLLMLNLLFLPSAGFSSTALTLFVPEPMRGRISGAYLLFATLIGVGPALSGSLSQLAFGHDGALGTSQLIVISGEIFIVCVLLAITLKPMRQAVASAFDGGWIDSARLDQPDMKCLR
jgi:MFS family permease